MQLKFEFSTKGTLNIRIDEKTYFSFGNKALSNNGPWETLLLHGFYEVNFRGNIIKERVTESTYLSKIQFKNKSKSCLDKNVFNHILKIIKKHINERGQIPDSVIPKLQEEIEIPFETEKTKKRTPKTIIEKKKKKTS